MKTAQTLLQALILITLATATGLAANALRDRRIELTRNYFPEGVRRTTPAEPIVPQNQAPERTTSEPEVLQHEFQSVTLEQAYQYYLVGDASIVFVDARNDAQYQQSHIPYAVQFFHYYPEQYLGNLRAYTDQADTIIVYCNGGTCEDSIQAARYLTTELDPPIDLNRVFVFEGGMREWCAAGYPIEPANGNCEYDDNEE